MPWFKEPLLHFLLIGVALFALYYQVADPQSDRPRRIEVSAADIERMANLWARRWQRPPTPAELQGLIKAHVREEVLYREARALGLEQNDTIVRRRMAQKMEFFFQDIAARKEPSDDELQDFMENNAERFRRPARLSLTQVYLSRDKRGGQVMQDAEMLLEDLRLQGASADPGPVSASNSPMPWRRCPWAAGRDLWNPVMACTWSSCMTASTPPCRRWPRSASGYAMNYCPSTSARRARPYTSDFASVTTW
jgi:hypothetical protein